MKTNTGSFRDGGILGIIPTEKENEPTLTSLPFLPSSSRVTGLHQETQHQLPRLRWVRACAVVCVPACQMRVKLTQKECSPRVTVWSWLACRLGRKNEEEEKKKSPTYGCLLFVFGLASVTHSQISHKFWHIVLVGPIMSALQTKTGWTECSWCVSCWR